MKIYISGKISGLDPVEAKKNFIKAELRLKHQGHEVMSPKGIMDFAGFEHEDYMHVCKAMVDVCDAVYMLANWRATKRAIKRHWAGTTRSKNTSRKTTRKKSLTRILAYDDRRMD